MVPDPQETVIGTGSPIRAAPFAFRGSAPQKKRNARIVTLADPQAATEEPITIETVRERGLRARGLPVAVGTNGDYRVRQLEASEVGDDAQATDLARRFAAYVQRVAAKIIETA